VIELRYEDVMNYVQHLVGEGDELQTWVHAKSEALSDHGVVPIDSTRGRFLELIARLRSPRRVLEIGSGAGYSALWIMKGIGKAGLLEAIEIDPTVAEQLKLNHENQVEEEGLDTSWAGVIDSQKIERPL